MSQTVHIRLELRPDGDCLTGRVISDAESREFHGWMGLIGALEALYGGALERVGVPAETAAD